MTDFKFIDLFCGIGGFHQALASLGGHCVFASDIDEDCQKTYYRNYGIMPVGDITKVDAADIPAHDVLCGGFPCQAFSIAGKRLGFNDPTKGTLFFDIVRILKYHKPKYLLLENVRNLASHDHGNTWRVIHQSLDDAGYNVSPMPVIFSPHYIGIPQHRERVFIMGVRKDVGELPDFHFNRKKAQPCTIDTVLQDESEIKNLKRYQLKHWEIELVDLWNEFLAGIRPKVKKLPMFPVTDLFMKSTTSAFNYEALALQKAMTARRNVLLYNAASDFIDPWLKKAYTYPKFKGAKRMLEWHAGNIENPDLWDTVMQFRQSGIRARPANHFPTLTAVMQTPIVGKRKRRITPRECARLQSFPDTFVYDEKEAQAYKQFGNSVNVEVVRLFARFLLGDTDLHQFYSKEMQVEPKVYKKRGRPRKNPLPTEPKRKRGRPRKNPLPEAGAAPKKRGRPRKNPLPEIVAPKKRGRPRKYPLPDAVAPRKRGRPRKYPLPPAAQIENQENVLTPIKRKRGRPRKNPL